MANVILLGRMPSVPVLLFLMCLSQLEAEQISCPSVCSCLGIFVDCSKRGLVQVPEDLPVWVENLELQNNGITYLSSDDFRGLEKLQQLDLSGNQLRTFNATAFHHLPRLTELKLDHNHLTEIPDVGRHSGLTSFSLSYNEIHSLNSSLIQGLTGLKTLDLSHNRLIEVPAGSFPNTTALHNLNLVGNRITNIEKGSLDNLTLLVELKLNRNRLAHLPKDLFKQLKHLQTLELNKNRFTKIEGLSFHGLERLRVLKLRHNGIRALMDGAFWGLKSIVHLQLDNNNITVVRKGRMYGLSSLRHLSLSFNHVASIDDSAWEFCQNLAHLDLTHNKLQAVEEGTFAQLPKLHSLHLDHNRLSYISEGAFSGVPELTTLELNHNEISWPIEDTNGAFVGLPRLTKLGLASNLIKSINKRAFTGLESLQHLDLGGNAIASVQNNAFGSLKDLMILKINTSSLLCDCNLNWFPEWLRDSSFLTMVEVNCAHPETLKNKSVMEVLAEDFTCDDYPKPFITEEPKTQTALKGDNLTLTCNATSTSKAPMTFIWKKDNINLKTPKVEQYARSPDGKGTEERSELHLTNISHAEAGRYQCVVSNNFGTTYSSKAKITVHVFPVFTKKPDNVTIKAGTIARLVCAAKGHPTPEIAWQKDGGDDFPAARERRMHVMPEDDVFFIVNVKATDMGIYTCTAQNAAGVVLANTSLTVLETPSFVKPMEHKETISGETTVLECLASGSPKPKLTWTKDGEALLVTERHFFTADSQLLIIVATVASDGGTYACEMSNSLGTERGYSHLKVIPAANPDHNRDHFSVGLIIIIVVCCAVVTSLLWVFIIYHTRKRASGVLDAEGGEHGSRTLHFPPITEYKGSIPQLYQDTNSEHSSSKDSGTGDSAKRSSDDLLPVLEGDSAQSIREETCDMPATAHPTDEESFLKFACTFQPTNHERSSRRPVSAEVVPRADYLARWSALSRSPSLPRLVRNGATPFHRESSSE